MPQELTKNLLSELSLFYPGVPLRKLYKRYTGKLDKHRTSSVSVESKQLILEKNVPLDDAKKNLKETENEGGDQEVETKGPLDKRGRGKRRLSSDGGISQEKKMARKSGDFFGALPHRDQDVSTNHPANKSRKKRGREDDSDDPQEKTAKGRRLSTRLQKKNTETMEENLLKPEASSNRKKRKRTTDSQQDVTETPGVSKGQEKPSDAPVISNSEKAVVETFVSDTLWTDFYRPVHSTEVMANASAVNKLRSWLEEWKVKREKTLRRELQQQKRYLYLKLCRHRIYTAQCT